METIFACYEMEVKYKKRMLNRQKIQNSKGAYLFFKEIFNNDIINWKEELFMLCLNKVNSVIGYYKVSSGGTSGTIVDPKIIFSIALSSGAQAIMISHNHPSGNIMPSQLDIKLTKELVQAGKLLSIPVLDHLIISENEYYSFADEGNC